ncbi:MAG: phage tail tip lysozyme, partial [Lachnospiraceae bacterium]|nr:phage tail tip lysozyme [Lachnospiraceae bacterium]
MDERVLQTQEWLNKTYGKVTDFPAVDEDGITGRSTFKALIYALQIEIGISNPDGVFGNDTLNKCPTLRESSTPNSDSPRNIIYILQGSLWCKGISPGGFTGVFGPKTANAIYNFQTAAGITADKVVYPYVLQGIMNTDAYTFHSTEDVYDTYRHEIQIGLNKYYGSRIGLIAPTGIWERTSHKNLIKAIQIEWGTTVDGVFGNGTLSKAPTLSKKTSGYTNSKRLMQWCLAINGFYPGSFSGTFDEDTFSSLYDFQQFLCLGADGICGKQTWASLITSRGSSDRKATALDTSKKITLENAAAIKNAGYTDVGRYLTNTPGGTLDKAMTSEELEILKAADLNVFPIFQTRGNEASYFTAEQGTADAQTAKAAAQNFGFPPSATIYFCVDYDVLMADIDSRILPYFRSVKAEMGNAYKIGAYGPRYICTKLAEKNLTTYSFVCDMSTGFTCNIGQKMPTNWAYDQFAEISVSKSEFSGMDYDKCIASPFRTATAPEDFIPLVDDGYDNSVYTYEQVLAGTGYYMQDSKLRYSDGVKTMQEKLTTAGYDCGIPDGRFGSETTSAIRRLQWFNELDINGRADKSTLVVLEAILNGSVTPPSGEYSVNFDNINKRFDTNQQIVYEALAEAGLGKIAIAGIMGNIEAESGFDTTWSDTGGAGICQWDDRKGKLEAYAASISGSKTDIHVQTQ